MHSLVVCVGHFQCQADYSGATFATGVTPKELAVQTLSSTDPITAKVIMAAGKGYKNIIVSDIKLLDMNGNPITSFSGTVKVKIPIPANADKTNLHVLRYDLSTSTVKDMNGVVEGNYMSLRQTISVIILWLSLSTKKRGQTVMRQSLICLSFRLYHWQHIFH